MLVSINNEYIINYFPLFKVLVELCIYDIKNKNYNQFTIMVKNPYYFNLTIKKNNNK